MTLLNGMLRGVYDQKKHDELVVAHQKLLKRVNQLKSQRQSLEVEINRIKNSSDYAYKVLRDKYHIRDENESIIFLDN